MGGTINGINGPIIATIANAANNITWTGDTANVGDPDQAAVQLGDYLEADGGLLMQVIALTKPTIPLTPPVTGRNLKPTEIQVNGNRARYGAQARTTQNFRVIRQPRKILGEETQQLPQDVAIQLYKLNPANPKDPKQWIYQSNPPKRTSVPVKIAPTPIGAREVGSVVTILTVDATGKPTPHGFSIGQTVEISGVLAPGYDGTFAIDSVPNPITFTYKSPFTNLPPSGSPPKGTPATSTIVYFEILFGPSGRVIGKGTGGAQRFAGTNPDGTTNALPTVMYKGVKTNSDDKAILWVRDTSADTTEVQNTPMLVTVQNRSGYIAVHPVDITTGGDAYSLTRDGRSSGF
jgi:hypothetical protein